MTPRQKLLFAGLLAISAGLIFFRLGRQDLLGDDAHYATRAIGYFDYMSSRQQTTPVQWFGSRPWWSYLSFHDHPPLFFSIQHIFFNLFGVSVVVSRLTSALAGLGSVIVMFFLGRRFGGDGLGFLAMTALAMNNYFIWQARIGLLESLFVFWLLLGLLYLVKALQGDDKFFIWSGVFFGAAMLTKYTFLFVLPAIGMYLLWQERSVFRSKKFWFGVTMWFLIISPILIFNFEMYKTRGHFDVQFADLFGQGNADWPVLGNRIDGFHINLIEPMKSLGQGMSWPYFSGAVISFLAVIVLAWRKQQKLLWLLLLPAALMFLFLVYVGGAERLLGVLSPFAALIFAIAIFQLWKYRLTALTAGLLFVYCLIYIFNTNHAVAAPANRFLVSTLRKENLGFNQLDQRLSHLLRQKRAPEAQKGVTNWIWYRQMKTEAIDFSELHDQSKQPWPYLFVYDVNMYWFPLAWVFDRWRFYDRFFIAGTDEFAAIVSAPNTRAVFDKYLTKDGMIFIKAGENTKLKRGEEMSQTKYVLKHFTDQNIQPEVIRDDKGREAFYIYTELPR